MILGVDQGTTGTTVVIINKKGRCIARATEKVKQFFPKPGWVEHDPEDIWMGVGRAIQKALRLAKIKPSQILAIGVTNQRETIGVFESSSPSSKKSQRETERPLHRFIVWQDRRTSDFCAQLSNHALSIQNSTGLTLDPYFSASKIRWLKDHLKLSEQSAVRFRTIDSFLFERLTGASAMEVTNASRTSLMNLKSLKWDDSLFSLFGIPRCWAPEIVPSEGYPWRTKSLPFLKEGIPVVAALGDQQAALFGQSCTEMGQGKITFGTGSFILLNTGLRPILSKNQLVSTVALQMRDRRTTYALEGSAFICGAWIDFLSNQLGILKTPKDSEAIAKKYTNPEGVLVVPALSGMGAPFWKPEMRAAVLGMTRGTRKEHLVRASLEALCFQNRALIDAMAKDASLSETEWKVDGGVVQNSFLIQIQADALNAKLIRPKNLEATATGAAWLAGLSIGLWSSSEIQKFWKPEREFLPRSVETTKLKQRYEEWSSVVDLLSRHRSTH